MSVLSRFPPIGLALLTAMLAGCGSPRGDGLDRPPPQPVITARGQFLNGTIEVVAQLGPFRLIDALPPDRVGGIPVVIDESREAAMRPARPFTQPALGQGGAGRPRMGQDTTRQSLTVTLRNIGSTPVRLRVAEVRSALGNFVPVPEIFTLEPGSLQALEPMRSSYPASIDELELVVRLRTETADEAKTLKLTL